MTRVPRTLRLAAGAVLAAWCWVSAAIPPFTTSIDVAVGVLVATMAVVAWWGRPARTGRPGRDAGRALGWRRIWPWLVVAGGLLAVELAAELSRPRRAHPTLSSMADAAMGSHLARAAVMVAWFVIGWCLFAPRAADP